MQNIIYESYNDKIVDLKMFRSHNAAGALHFHRSFELIYVLDGTLSATVGNRELEASEDDIVFVPKYYAHNYGVVTDYHKFVFMVPPDIYNDFEKPLAQNTLPALMADKEFNRTLRPMMETLYENIGDKSKLVKKGYMDVFMGELIAHYPLEPIQKNSNIELLVKILDFIDENYAQNLTLEYISSTFGYNKYYFSKLFNRFIGENINTYINIVRLQQLMKKAKQADNVNITELAFECGFDSLSTFYRYFSKVYGTSPHAALSKN